MPRPITKDTTLCMSLAARPSNFGTRFHNYLYEALDLDYLYKAFTTTDLPAAIGGVRALGIRGCAISMPFKEAVIALVDEMDESARAIESVNTLVNTAGHLKAYNTDYVAIRKLLAAHRVPPDCAFALRGSGGMAKAVACALRDAGFRTGTIVARNEAAGKALAGLYGFDWRAEMGDWTADLLINVTPLGMAGGADADTLAFDDAAIRAARMVFDVVALPAETPLIRRAQARGKPVITGAEVFAIQAVEQFALYTGVRPDDALFKRAAAYARG
ncbi:MAG: shikimate 5-dehydrogenase [Propionivibrio sp.]|nr:shikimate 5-dehydrogenase [Propionivibrio sp.]